MTNNILAIECSSPYLSIGLLTNEHIYSVEKEGQRKHSEHILPIIETLLAEHHVDKQALTTIAVGIGPGSFIGVRLAHAIAQGLCFGNQANILPLSSLQIIAQAAYLKYKTNNILVLQDARKNELYVGHFQLKDNVMMPVSDESLMTAEAVNDYLKSLSTDITCIGSGIEAYPDLQINPEQCLNIGECNLSEGAINIAELAELEQVAKSETNYVRNHVADLPKTK